MFYSFYLFRIFLKGNHHLFTFLAEAREERKQHGYFYTNILLHLRWVNKYLALFTSLLAPETWSEKRWLRLCTFFFFFWPCYTHVTVNTLTNSPITDLDSPRQHMIGWGERERRQVIGRNHDTSQRDDSWAATISFPPDSLTNNGARDNSRRLLLPCWESLRVTKYVIKIVTLKHYIVEAKHAVRSIHDER